MLTDNISQSLAKVFPTTFSLLRIPVPLALPAATPHSSLDLLLSLGKLQNKMAALDFLPHCL